jgi:hypothetical protein
MPEYYGYVYLTVNKVNGKAYVGQHHAPVFTNKYLGSGYGIVNAIKKYGKNNFEVQLLVYCQTQKELDEEEVYHIATYRKLFGKELYNIANGGGSPMAGRSCAESTKVKISNANKGRVKSQETRDKIGKAHKGKIISQITKGKMSSSRKQCIKDNPYLIEIARKNMKEYNEKIKGDYRKGWKMTEEQRKKLRDLHIGMKMKYKEGFHPSSKKTLCIETGKIYNSANKAVKETGITNIGMVLCGLQEKAGGYHWKYV